MGWVVKVVTGISELLSHVLQSQRHTNVTSYWLAYSIHINDLHSETTN